MSEPLRLSNSEMADFRQCKRKWYLGTYRRLRKRAIDAPGSSLSIGNRVHDALAGYYDPTQPDFDPIAYITATIDAEMQAVGEYAKDYEKERDLTVAMVNGYFEWLEETGHDQDLVLLGSETFVEVPLADISGTPVTLLSKLDAPVERKSDGAKLALEHKTVSSLEQPLPLLKLDTQLLTEHLARFLHAQANGATAEEAYDQCHGILYNMLRKVKRTASAKPPFYGRVDVPHNIHELRNHWRHVYATAQQILATRAALDAGVDHHKAAPPSPTRDCTWKCPFFQVCVMADDGSDFEGALEGLYEERDPLERYAEATEL